MKDYLFRGELVDLDPQLYELTQIEAERQFRRLILIPSESTSPLSVRAALASAFHNIYAEGYPREETRWMIEEEIFDFDRRLTEYRRYSDPRYYKGVEYADIVEALARRRCAEAFAANSLTADDLFVNVQPLSGGPANNAVYHAMVEPGDTVMGMDLIHGGHLSHGSPVNRSGKYYNIVSYTVDPETERVDYEAMRELALAHKPKMIIGGFSSYPWTVDWAAYRSIADEVGAYLLADISHVAGLVVGAVYPSPIGIADVITTTTHKTLCGPRGAVIITHIPSIARKIDRAVFPGEQGGPHVNVFASLALTFKLAQTETFAVLQREIVNNCQVFTHRLKERGFRIPFGGTNTHLMNLDCKSIKGTDGVELNGDYAARILDVAGIVVNRNTIPGDRSALNPSGIRMGTPWVTQRGFGEKEVTELADIIADILLATHPYRDPTKSRLSQRAKVDFGVLSEARKRVAGLAEKAGIDFEPTSHGYPHFPHRETVPDDILEWAVFKVSGEKAVEFINFVVSSDVEALDIGKSQATSFQTTDGKVEGTIARAQDHTYYLQVDADDANLTGSWLRDLSDGYILFEKETLIRKIPGPVSIVNTGNGIGSNKNVPDPTSNSSALANHKPYYIGIPKSSEHPGSPLPTFEWEISEKELTSPKELRTTPLHEAHIKIGAKMVPFEGWEMPVWYTSVKEEHAAVRGAAGLFDVAHMGIYQAEGAYALPFLDSLCANDISTLSIGESLYTHFLDPDGNVIDDLLVYRRDFTKYMLVVNASNDDKDWAWLNTVKSGEVKVDNKRTWAKVYGRGVTLRNLRDSKEGPHRKVDLAIQGPKSLESLLSLDGSREALHKVRSLKWSELCEVTLGGFDLIISRTGYTGERLGFELFVHPEQSVDLWSAILQVGEPLGLKACGLGARDSLRTEAGLPLYGHEMGGVLNLGVGEAGFASYVKTYKPWFIGREAFLRQENKRTGEVIRFTFNETGIRMAHQGDPVLDKRGRAIGVVTSCAIDSKGYLTGQAYLNEKYTKKGTSIFIFQSASGKTPKPPAELEFGDRAPIPSAAKVVRRFPRL